MEYIEKIDKTQLDAHFKAFNSIEISHVCMGYANAIFLECGELKEDIVGVKKRVHLVGQITFMLECDWQLSDNHQVLYEWASPKDEIEDQIVQLIGLQISKLSLVDRTSEILIVLNNGWVLQTMPEGPDTYPHWSIGIRDIDGIAIHPEWKKEDVSVWLSYEDSAFQRSYCFDDVAFRNKKFLREYCK